MASFKHLIDTAQALRKGGKQSDDNNLDDLQVAYILNEIRELLVKREVDKKNRISEVYVQTAPCVPMILVPNTECPELDYGCKILRTKEPIPQPISHNKGDGIRAVGSVDSTEYYQRTNPERAVWDKYAPLTGSLRKYLYRDRHIYITNESEISDILIRGLFFQPEELARYNSTEKICFDWASTEYPTPGWMQKIIATMAYEAEFQIVNVTVPDDKNDNRDV